MKKNTFPWKIFTQITVVSCVIIFLAIFTTGLFFTPKIDGPTFFFLILLSVLFGTLVFWINRRIVRPLQRIILKTENLLTHTPEKLTPEEIQTEVYGEWSTLEENLENIRKEFEGKTLSLDNERVELSTMMAAISDGILAIDQKGLVLFYNTRFELLTTQKSIAQKKLWEIFREPEILNIYEKALKQGTPQETTLVTFTINQQKKYYSVAVSPLRNKEGEVYGAVGVFHDISDLKAAEQMRIDFVANVSHELRTPLTSIKGYAETIQSDLVSNRKIEKEFLEIILRNSNRLMNLMEDLLDLSSIESSHQIQKELISTEDLTTKIVSNLQKKIEEKKHKVVCVYNAKSVYADIQRTEQVLVNLLDNAIKYSLEKGTIEIIWDEEENFTVLKVKDSGSGIAFEHQTRLFERFYRVDKARSREQGGTGLGLAIVKHIMLRHNGSVSVESIPNQGATFICRFPKDDINI
jgi:two-component system phosphate regulon sensor histidine kinase PhoR